MNTGHKLRKTSSTFSLPSPYPKTKYRIVNMNYAIIELCNNFLLNQKFSSLSSANSDVVCRTKNKVYWHSPCRAYPGMETKPSFLQKNCKCFTFTKHNTIFQVAMQSWIMLRIIPCFFPSWFLTIVNVVSSSKVTKWAPEWSVTDVDSFSVFGGIFGTILLKFGTEK